MSPVSFWAILPAAGNGSRMGTSVKKQFLCLPDGREILATALQIFEDCPRIDGIVIVSGQDDLPRCRSLCEAYHFSKVRHFVSGGATRQESVRNGLHALPGDCTHAVIHDAARPFLRMKDLNAVLDDALQYGASLMAVPSKDTIKRADPSGFVLETPDRSTLWNIQTPQVFEKELLFQAHEKAAAVSDTFCTDDGQVVERYTGHRVHLCRGSYSNRKITTPDDLEIPNKMRSQ